MNFAISTELGPDKRPFSPEFNPLSYCFFFSLPLLDTAEAQTLELVLLWNKPTGKPIRPTTTELLKQTKCVCHDCFQPSTEEKDHKRNRGKKTNIPVECGCSVHFKRVENVTCVRVCFVLVSFPLDKQLQQAILHLPTLELSIETAQTTTKKWKKKHKNKQQQQGKSPNNNKLWSRCPSSFQQQQAITLLVVFVSCFFLP